MADDVRVKLWLEGGARFVSGMRNARRSVKDLRQEMQKANREARQTSVSFQLVQRTLALVKPAALITGVGLLAQLLSSAAAGGIALASALAPLSGLLGALPGLASAAGQGLGVAMLSVQGLSDAVGGLNDSLDPAALATLSPAAQELATRLDALKAPILQLQTQLTGAMFPGVEQGISSLQPVLTALTPSLVATAVALGALAASAGALAATWKDDLVVQSERNVVTISRLGQAALYVADAIRHVTIAAGPLVSWLTATTLAWAKATDAAAANGRQTGRLADFFDHTRRVLERVLSIGGNLARTLWNVGDAGAALGGDMLRSLDQVTARMAALSGSAQGQRGIAKFFNDAKPAIYETARLVRDIAVDFLKLGAGTGVAPLIKQLRTQLLPVVFQVLQNTTKAFGPSLINAIVQIAKAFEPLAGSSGPLVLYVDTLAKLAQAAAWIMHTVPGGTAAITALVGAMAISRAAGLVSLVTGMGSLVGTVMTLTPAARAAATANGTLTASQWLLNAAMAANPIVLTIAAVVALGAAFVVAYEKVGWFRTGVQAVWGWIKGNWPYLLGILTGPFGLAAVYIIRHWDAVKQKFSDVVTFLKRLPGSMASAAKDVFMPYYTWADRVVHAIADRFRQLVQFVKDVPGEILKAVKSAPGAVGGLISSAAGKLNPFAATGGTIMQPGWAVVGERGPELVRMPRAATVFDSSQSMAAMAGVQSPRVQVPAPAPVQVAKMRQPGAGGGPQIVLPDIRVDVHHGDVRLDGELVGSHTGRAVASWKARR